jgi:hypothetical protein
LGYLGANDLTRGTFPKTSFRPKGEIFLHLSIVDRKLQEV